MIETALVALLPAGFLVLLFGGGELFRRRKIAQDGDAPVRRSLFYAAKYGILVLWAAMVVQAGGIALSPVAVPRVLQIAALLLWGAGFLLLFAGRLGMGDSFRLGTPREATRLRVTGLFRLSRNPMYVGMYATTAAAVLNTLNPVVLALAVFVVAVHHQIVLVEEQHLQEVFGRDYREYAGRVRRYL